MQRNCQEFEISVGYIDFSGLQGEILSQNNIAVQKNIPFHSWGN